MWQVSGEAYFALAMGMTAIARTPVLPAATPEGTLSARRGSSIPALAALQCFTGATAEKLTLQEPLSG